MIRVLFIMVVGGGDDIDLRGEGLGWNSYKDSRFKCVYSLWGT